MACESPNAEAEASYPAPPEESCSLSVHLPESMMLSKLGKLYLRKTVSVGSLILLDEGSAEVAACHKGALLKAIQADPSFTVREQYENKFV